MSPINDMISTQLKHRTIREFKDNNIPEEIFNTLMEVARRTATSNGMQQYSIIRITDPDIKKKISKVCQQEYVAKAPELLIFIVDQYRNYRIAIEKDPNTEKKIDIDRFFQGFTDASIAAQNVVNAAESMDLGSMYLGSILNDTKEICNILNLPKYTFPVVGLGLGYPNQDPQLKPRIENSLKVFENEYKYFDSYLEEIREYDEEMQTYYDLRNTKKPLDSFSDQAVVKLTKVIARRQDILKVIKEQGFTLNL